MCILNDYIARQPKDIELPLGKVTVAVLHDGEMDESKEPVVEKPVVKPKVKVVNKPTPTVTPQPSNKRLFRVSAYCPCVKCCGKSDGITATGVKATANRTIAVDPRKIPYGTKIRLNGREYIAEDCGGAIKGDKLDIYFDTHQEALAFGVRYLEGEIIR